jgi:3',5'-cyclic AMP phosphodiesterase CpdA
MNILHISDLHFGPNHWDGDDQILLEKINSYAADIVINTGDCTTDGLESEYADAGKFLKASLARMSYRLPGIMTNEANAPMNSFGPILTILRLSRFLKRQTPARSTFF